MRGLFLAENSYSAAELMNGRYWLGTADFAPSPSGLLLRQQRSLVLRFPKMTALRSITDYFSHEQKRRFLTLRGHASISSVRHSCSKVCNKLRLDLDLDHHVVFFSRNAMLLDFLPR